MSEKKPDNYTAPTEVYDKKGRASIPKYKFTKVINGEFSDIIVYSKYRDKEYKFSRDEILKYVGTGIVEERSTPKGMVVVVINFLYIDNKRGSIETN